jgi:transposase
LSRHPELTVTSRDRGGGYGQAATRAAPQAVQVADRWHPMENVNAAFLEAVRRSMRPIRMALGSTAIDPALLTHAERLQHEGYLRWEEAYGIIRALAKAGTPIKEIVRRTRRSRKLVRDSQTANVRSPETRPAPCSPSRPSVGIGCIEIE